MQGIWSGTISFSLVAIPVRLVRAVTTGRVSFRLLHAADYSPLARKMVCPKEGEIVPPEEIVRGYELGPDNYLPITAEELASVSPERSRTIEIMEFIDIGEVDPLYFDHPYYLVPLKGGEKAYRLLAEIMASRGRAGLARFVLAEREHLVAVRSEGGGSGPRHPPLPRGYPFRCGHGADRGPRGGRDKEPDAPEHRGDDGRLRPGKVCGRAAKQAPGAP